MKHHRLLSGLMAALLLAGASRAATQPANPVRRVVFENGLTLLVREDHSAPIVSAQAWCRAGSVNEGRLIGAGMSHVLEHMLFKGTAKRGVGTISKEVESKGGDINAYTSFEQTVYHIDLPAENWQTAVDILADCMMNATIPAEELTKEKDVILREMAMNKDDPARRSGRMLSETAYTTHPYRYTVIGYPDIYNRITRDDVVAYYRQMYVPNNLVFVVVGDVKAAEVETLLRDLTKDWKMAAIEPVALPVEPPQLATRERHEEMDIKLSHVQLAWHGPAMTDPDMYPLDVLAIIAGQGRSSRLYRELRQNQGLVFSIDAGNWTPRYPGLFEVDAVAADDKRDAAIKAVREQMKRFINEPITDAELQRAIKATLAGHVSRLKTMSGQASDLASNEILAGNPNFSETYVSQIAKVRAEDLRRVAEKYFKDENLTIVTLNPLGTAPLAATATNVTGAVQVQKFELANGLRLLVREDHKLPLVEFRVLCQGGVFAETATDSGVTKLMARTLLKGTTSRSAEKIAEALENVGGSINYFAGNNSFGLSANAMRPDFDLALEVLADVCVNPEFPVDKLERERQSQLAEIKAEDDQIMRVAQQLLREAMFRQHPYRLNTLGTADSVAKLTRADLQQSHRRYLVPNNMVVCVFGDVDAEAVKKAVEAKFGALKPGTPEFKAAPERLDKSVRSEVTRPKEQAVLLLGYSGTDIRSPDRFAMELLDNAYSGMGSRVFQRLRDELGLCYYVGAQQLLGLQPGFLMFYIGTTGENVATCEKEFGAELAKLKAEGLTAQELENAKNNIIGQRKVGMQDNGQFAMTVGLDELYGLGYDFWRTQDEKYRAVTTDDIKQVAAKYLGDKPSATIIVKPSPKEK
jgi:zinc protease